MAIVPLHSVQTSPSEAATPKKLPLLVMVHGLDSSSHTWMPTIEALKDEIPCLAVDQRGCGFSPLGEIDDFSQEALVDDLHQAIQQYKQTAHSARSNGDVILLGHSLGGRIVLGYAAKYPDKVAVCIVEDMDIEPRQPTKNGFVKLQPYESPFSQRWSGKEALVEAFKAAGYPEDFLEGCIATGRVGPDPQDESGSAWWSQVNPDFRKFCYPHVLSTEQGKADCRTIAAYTGTLPCHVMVAGSEGTVCIDASIQEMKEILGDQLDVHQYPTAAHSIHNTASSEFLQTMRSIIAKTSQ